MKPVSSLREPLRGISECHSTWFVTSVAVLLLPLPIIISLDDSPHSKMLAAVKWEFPLKRWFWFTFKLVSWVLRKGAGSLSCAPAADHKWAAGHSCKYQAVLAAAALPACAGSPPNSEPCLNLLTFWGTKAAGSPLGQGTATCGCKTHRITDSQHVLGWKGPLKVV